MDATVFKHYYKDIKKALEELRLSDALALEENILYTNPTWPFMDEVVSIRQAYQGLLGCMEHGFRDDSRKESFHHLILRTYKMLHLLTRYYQKETPHSLYSKTCLKANRESYLSYQTILEKSLDTQHTSGSEEILKTVLRTREQCALDLFNQIWTTGTFSDLDIKELRNLLNSEKVLRKDVLLCLAALLLQQCVCPDAAILSLFLEQSLRTDKEIKIRATVSWLLLLLRYEKEYMLDANLKKQVFEIFQQPGIQDIVCYTLNSCYQSMESLNTLNKMQKEFMPLLSGEKLFTGSEEEVQKLIMKSMKEMEKLMNSGADLQFASFIQDKHYGFFKQLGNWLLPFDEHHSETEFILRKEEAPVPTLRVILANPGLCDNDKWSMFFKTLKLNLPLQIQGLNPEEMEMIDNTVTSKTCARNFVHDLFRLYNLFPYRLELVNLLSQDFSPAAHTFLYKVMSEEKLFILAQIMYHNRVYSGCIKLLSRFTKNELYAYEAHKLAGNAWRALEQYDHAIMDYEAACDLKQDEETFQFLAFCYKQKENYGEASALYLCLLENDPENWVICKQLASCLIQNEETDRAIPLLYQIAYLNEKEQDFVQSSLAWCYLQEDKLEEAWAAWEKIGKKSLTDMLNGGHICWAIKDYKNAMDFYKYYLSKSTDRKKAEEQMLNDVKIMKRYQLTRLELRLILEINR